jgi:hypothetical protein
MEKLCDEDEKKPIRWTRWNRAIGLMSGSTGEKGNPESEYDSDSDEYEYRETARDFTDSDYSDPDPPEPSDKESAGPSSGAHDEDDGDDAYNDIQEQPKN